MNTLKNFKDIIDSLNKRNATSQHDERFTLCASACKRDNCE